MTEDPRVREKKEREAALASVGEAVEDSGREVQPTALRQMVSVRLEGDLIASLRRISRLRQMSVSDAMREAIEKYVVEMGDPRRAIWIDAPRYTAGTPITFVAASGYSGSVSIEGDASYQISSAAW